MENLKLMYNDEQLRKIYNDWIESKITESAKLLYTFTDKTGDFNRFLIDHTYNIGITFKISHQTKYYSKTSKEVCYYRRRDVEILYTKI